MILVTGGTGLVGIHLLMRLCKLPSQHIIAMYRSLDKLEKASVLFLENNTLAEWKLIEWVEGDITEIPSLECVFDAYKITQVYHCAAYVTFQRSAFDTLKKVNIEGTANMVNFSVDYKVEKFCYVSSIATLNSETNQTVFNETSRWNSEQNNSGYAISKFGGEMEVWRGSEEGLSVIIVHPGVIVGEVFRKGSSSDIFKNLKKGMPFFTNGGTGYVSAFDVAKAITELMDSDIKNDNFILVSENLNHRKVTQTITDIYGKKGPFFEAPKFLVLLVARAEYVLDNVFGYCPKIALDMVDSLFVVSKYSSKKIEKALDFKFEAIIPVLKKVAKNVIN